VEGPDSCRMTAAAETSGVSHASKLEATVHVPFAGLEESQDRALAPSPSTLSLYGPPPPSRSTKPDLTVIGVIYYPTVVAETALIVIWTLIDGAD
jgi:hypothetical protein